MLGDCLASVRGAVDEIVVVDTGSADGSVAIARAAGARVFDVPWCDDFAFARNASLAQATGDWVLVLDADERLAPGAADALRAAVDTARFDCGLLRLHNAARVDAPTAEVLAGSARLGDVHRVPRLLRREPDLRFVGVVHETVAPSIALRGNRYGDVAVDIVHLGATAALRVSRDKFERNVRLLRALAAASPDDPSAQGYLANEFIEREAWERAWEACEEGWALLPKVAVATGYRPSVLRLGVARAKVQLRQRDYAGVLETTARVRAIEGAHPDLDAIEGVSWELRALAEGDDAERVRCIDAALRCHGAALAQGERFFPLSFVAGAATWSAWTRIGVLRLLRSEVSAAREAFAAALVVNPRADEAALGVVECMFEAGDAAGALGAVEKHLGATPDGWVLAAAAAEELGALDAMRAFLAKCQQTLEGGYVSPHRAERHGELLAALAIYHGAPFAAASRVGALGALMARAPMPEGARGPYPSERAALRRIVKNLSPGDRARWLPALLDARAEALVPGVGAHLREVADALGVTLPPMS